MIVEAERGELAWLWDKQRYEALRHDDDAVIEAGSDAFHLIRTELTGDLHAEAIAEVSRIVKEATGIGLATYVDGVLIGERGCLNCGSDDPEASGYCDVCQEWMLSVAIKQYVRGELHELTGR